MKSEATTRSTKSTENEEYKAFFEEIVEKKPKLRKQ